MDTRKALPRILGGFLLLILGLILFFKGADFGGWAFQFRSTRVIFLGGGGALLVGVFFALGGVLLSEGLLIRKYNRKE